MKKPLLRMLWCESVAPLGKPVVPEVYWMLIGSSNCSAASRAASSSSATRVAVGQQRVPVVVEHDRLAQRRGSAPRTSSSMRDVVGLAEAAREQEQR